MKRWIICFALALSACATGYRAAYTAGAVTKEFVTTEHAAYDAQVQNKLKSCDPAQNTKSTVKTKIDFDACMTTMYSQATQERVVQALAAYKAAAEVTSAVLLSVDPARGGGKTLSPEQRAELRLSVERTLGAAMDVVEAFPGGKALAAKLKKLLP